jgi:hypothetical protein
MMTSPTVICFSTWSAVCALAVIADITTIKAIIVPFIPYFFYEKTLAAPNKGVQGAYTFSTEVY